MVVTRNHEQCVRTNPIHDLGLSGKLQGNGMSDATCTKYTQLWSYYAAQHKLGWK